MTRIYLIRHCEAEGNVYRRAQGRYDGMPSAKGLLQVAALAERFRDEKLDALYSSDLTRARRTAEAITKYHDLPLHPEPRLREWGLGAWEDVPFGNLGYAYPEMLYNFNNNPAAWHTEGGEDFSHLQARFRAAIADVVAAHAGGTAVCVSHGMAIRAYLADILGVPSEEIRRVPHGDNTAVSLVEVEPGGETRVVFSNDVSHLTGPLSTLARQSWWQDPHAVDPNNVRFQRLDPRKHPQSYLSFYEKTWLAVHGRPDGFQPSLYLDAAVRHVKADPDALVTILRPDGEVVGITELDTERGRDRGMGWICLCCVEEQWRRRLLGVQLIGHAVSVFRRLGRRAVQLNVFEKNVGAIRFYEACGFRPAGETQGVHGTLLIMEKAL